MSRRRSADVGSLELLLDTICNVFGTIILLTLLIALMVTRSSSSAARQTATPASRSELITAETERDELTRRLVRMQKAEAESSDLSGVLISEELREHARRLREAEAKRGQLVQAKSDATGAATDAQTAINDINEDAADRQEQIDRAKKEVDALKMKRDEAIEKSSRDAAIPKMAATSLTVEAMYFLKGGKLFGPFEHADGSPNEREFKRIPRGGALIVQEIVAAGTSVDPQAKAIEPIRREFAEVDPSNAYVKLWVWSDSYQCFNAVRIALEERGVKYELKPSAEGTIVYLTVGPKEPAVVQ